MLVNLISKFVFTAIISVASLELYRALLLQLREVPEANAENRPELVGLTIQIQNIGRGHSYASSVAMTGSYELRGYFHRSPSVALTMC